VFITEYLDMRRETNSEVLRVTMRHERDLQRPVASVTVLQKGV
jgi:hypothetical protein